MDKIPLSVIILSRQEEANIAYSIGNVISWVQDVFVLDSGSTDQTCSIAESLGAKVFYRQFDNYAAQRNYAIKELPTSTVWILFLDADEYLSDELRSEIINMFNNEEIDKNDGYYMKRRFYFLNKWIKYGGYYPTWILRLFRKEKALFEREVNEHINLNGKVSYLKNDFIDHNRKGVHDWLEKHNKYATLEAQQFGKTHTGISSFWGAQAERKQWIRQNIWNKFLPPLVRPFIYFIYRYFIRFGFMDGKVGFIFHFLHGLVYTFLIDVKYLEMKYYSKKQ